MPVAGPCGVAVAKMILGAPETEVGLPGGFLISERRVEVARGRGEMKINVTLMDELKELLKEEHLN